MVQRKRDKVITQSGRFLLLLSLLLAAIGFISLISQSRVPAAYAAQCYPGECAPNKYVCQGGTMCCTGGGCPSWVCNQSGCTFKIGSGCYGPEYCEDWDWVSQCTQYWDSTCYQYWDSTCTLHRHAPDWRNHWHGCLKWAGCYKWRGCLKCVDWTRDRCGDVYNTGGTCGWCTGVDPGNGGGGGGGGCSGA